MADFFQSLPRGILIFGLLAAGVVGVVLYQPLASVCDPQIENFRAQFVGDLFPYKVKEAKSTQTAPPRMQAYLTQCREGASSGSCYQYFEVIRRMVNYIHQSDEACYPEFMRLKAMSETLKSSLRLMMFFAWGEGPQTENLSDIQGWFREYELSTFCDVQNGLKKIMGEEPFDGLKWSLISSLPAKQGGREIPMTAEQKSRLSLFRVPCNFF